VVTSTEWEKRRSIDASSAGSRRVDGRENDSGVIPSSDSLMLLDVRQLVRTDDDALIYVTYQGRCDRTRGTYTVAPTFETSDQRYQWLNAVQAIGQGRSEGDDIVYEMFEVL
jgi:hypothetical protein